MSIPVVLDTHEEEYGRILRGHGFLTPPTVLHTRFPFNAIERAALALPELIAAGSEIMRREIQSLPLLDAERVNGGEVRSLMRYYHFLQNAYVHATPQMKAVPANIAVPSVVLARKVSVAKPPVLSYMSAVLDNWQVVDSRKPIRAGNVRPIVTFTRLRDEAGFLMQHALIEYAMRRALAELVSLGKNVASGSRGDAVARLHIVTNALTNAHSLFSGMTDCCCPSVYYYNVRPWLDKFVDVRFLGVGSYNGAPQSFVGASGAQSSILAAIDAALGVRHKPSKLAWELHDSMPPEQILFIQCVGQNPTRSLAIAYKTSDKDLCAAHNECVSHLRALRIAHGAFAYRYVGVYNKKAYGTGGTYFREFLEQYVKDTEATMV